jgi:ankyrin repeat protein
MLIDFKALCQQLQVNSQEYNEDNLKSLKKWCEKNISQDIQFSGDIHEEYEHYLHLAQHFLDEFSVQASENPRQSQKQWDGLNAIQYCAWQGYDRYLESIDCTESDLNTPTIAGMTPLHLAAVQGNFYTVQTLLSKGAKVQVLNNNSQYPIFSALIIPVIYDEKLLTQKEKIFTKLFAKAPVTITHQDLNNNTVAHQMALHGLTSLMIELCKENRPLVFIKNNHSHYPIHTAILNNQKSIAKLLLNIDEVPDLEDSQNRTALHYAARYGDGAMVQICCESTNDLNTLDNEGKTPLMLAEESGNIEATEVLIKNGARKEFPKFDTF